MAAWDWVVVMSLPKVDNGGATNVTLRAVKPQAFEVRGGIDIVQGQNFKPGLDEVIVGSEVIVVAQGAKEYREVGPRLRKGQALVDLVHAVDPGSVASGEYDGLAW